jgi:hypothetical protein
MRNQAACRYAMAVTVCCLFFSALEKLLVAPMQTMLSLPGDGLHLRRDAFVALRIVGLIVGRCR